MPVPAESITSNSLTTTAPQATEQDAADIARHHFGWTAEVRSLTSERDRNFHLTAPDGHEFVLKIANAAEHPDVTNLQTAVLQHIAARDPGLPVSRVCLSVDGQPEVRIILPPGSRHIVRLLTYLPGKPLHLAATSPAQRRALGRCLARIGLALRDFRHPASSHELLWDVKHAAKLRPLLVHIADDTRRHLASAALDVFEGEVMTRLPEFRTQVVHNDFNPHNVLVDAVDTDRVAGVLDFGDVVETALINDVAVAASYQFEGDDPLGRAADLVAAYHAVSPLTPVEVDCLFDLITVRQVMSVAITEWRASLYPENRTYILRNQPRAAGALGYLSAIGRDRGRAVLRRACGME